jgi:hypothetical protein
MQVQGYGDPLNQSFTLGSEPLFHNDICDIPSYFFVGEVGYMAGLGLVGVGGEAGSDRELSAQWMASKVTSVEEASSRQQIVSRVISTPEVSDFSITA